MRDLLFIRHKFMTRIITNCNYLGKKQLLVMVSALLIEEQHIHCKDFHLSDRRLYVGFLKVLFNILRDTVTFKSSSCCYTLSIVEMLVLNSCYQLRPIVICMFWGSFLCTLLQAVWAWRQILETASRLSFNLTRAWLCSISISKVKARSLSSGENLSC